MAIAYTDLGETDSAREMVREAEKSAPASERGYSSGMRSARISPSLARTMPEAMRGRHRFSACRGRDARRDGSPLFRRLTIAP